ARERPCGLSVARGCALMGLPRLTFYETQATQPVQDALLVERIGEICAEFPRYGYRRVTAQLHLDGVIANHKRVMRIMLQQGLSVRPKRRFVATTDSDHNGPIFPNLAKDMAPTGRISSGWPTSLMSRSQPASL